MGMPTLTDLLKKYCFSSAAKAPKKSITYAWFVSLFLVIIAFIVACVIAAKMATNSTADMKIAGFLAMWSAFLLIFTSIVGTVIMRRYQASVSIGFLLGLIFVLSNQMLIIFGIFADRTNVDTETTIKQADGAMASFAFFLFLVYATFGTMLAVFRNDIIKDNDDVNSAMAGQGGGNDDDSVELPPENI